MVTWIVSFLDIGYLRVFPLQSGTEEESDGLAFLNEMESGDASDSYSPSEYVYRWTTDSCNLALYNAPRTTVTYGHNWRTHASYKGILPQSLSHILSYSTAVCCARQWKLRNGLWDFSAQAMVRKTRTFRYHESLSDGSLYKRLYCIQNLQIPEVILPHPQLQRMGPQRVNLKGTFPKLMMMLQMYRFSHFLETKVHLSCRSKCTSSKSLFCLH